MCRDNSIEYLKQKGDDSRALLKDNFEKLRSPEGKLHAFVELVKNHPELELCFRGNSDERIIIYYNNHKIFDVKYTGLTTISFNHARYCKNWKGFLLALKTYGFEVKNDFEEYKKSEYDINYINSKKYKGAKQINSDEIEKIYTTILKPIFDCYFKKIASYKNERKKPLDYFKNEYSTPHILKEKLRQHELYSALTYGSNNYFLYDLEFQQKNAGGGNKPDMLAVKFNNGKPEKLLLVEVKCTESSLNGTSGLKEHIKGMQKYIKDDDKKTDRRKEACDILNQYAQLNLRGLAPDHIFKKDDFDDHLDFGIMLIVTDEAKKSKKIKDLMITKQNIPAYPAADVYIYES